ncbi:hypothetical protein NC652_016370 [Populus alba x Populus x berolinensis]|nr:hypothetical protein NC652_016370 [Populus alba x Populus x berolinensis]
MNLGVADLTRLGCEKTLIFIVEENYYEKLKRSGEGTVELVENEKEATTSICWISMVARLRK